MGPGWVRSTSRSCSTTGGTHLVTGRLSTIGAVPSVPVVRSGMVMSMAMSLGTSSRRSTLPLMMTIASSAIAVA